jgi:hypothetical protein
LCIVGLLHQAWDLWSAHRHHQWESSDDRDGWLFGSGWRVVLSLGMAATLALDYFDAYGVISLVEAEEGMYSTGRLTREALLRLVLLLAVAGAAKRRVSPQPSCLRSWSRDGLGGVALIAICFVICLDASLVPMLVHVAIRGMDLYRPSLIFGVARDPSAYVDLTAATNAFFARAAFSAALIPIHLVLIAALAWQWQRGVIRRLLIAAPLAAGLTVAATFTVWAFREGFATVSPYLAPFVMIEPVYRWVLLLALIVLAGAAAGARFCYRASRWKSISEIVWYRRPGFYLHERSLLLVSLIAICGARTIVDYAGYMGGFRITELVYMVLHNPTALLNLALILAAVQVLWSNRRRTAAEYATGPFALSLPAWTAVSLACIVAISAGIPTLYWLAFALWLKSGSL